MEDNEIYSFVCGFMACLLLVAYASFSKDLRRNKGLPKARNPPPPPKIK